MTTDAGTRATVERVLAAHVYDDVGYLCSAPDCDWVWDFRESNPRILHRHHVAAKVAEALAAQPSGLAERLRELADEICEAGDLKLPAVYIAGRLRALLAQEDR